MVDPVWPWPNVFRSLHHSPNFFSLLVKISLLCRAVLINNLWTFDLRPVAPQRLGQLLGLYAEDSDSGHSGAECSWGRTSTCQQPDLRTRRHAVLAAGGVDVGSSSWPTAHK